MKKYKHQIIGLILLIIILLSCSKPDGHMCKWRLCPYKGIQPIDYQRVAQYYNEGYEESYQMDMLHLRYPDEEYDELEERYRIERLVTTI